MLEVILKSFEEPDRVQVFDKGKFEVVEIGGLTIGAPPMNLDGSGPSTLGPQPGHASAR